MAKIEECERCEIKFYDIGNLKAGVRVKRHMKTGPEKHREHGSSAPRKVDSCQEVRTKIVAYFRMVDSKAKAPCSNF